MFRSAVDHPITRKWTFEVADPSYKYYQGDQWTRSEKSDLKKRNQPEVVENEVKPIIDRLYGQFRRQRTAIKFIGRNPQDGPISAGLTDLLRFVDQQNENEFVEGEVVMDGLIGGRGVYEITCTQDIDGTHRIHLRAEDPFSIFLDPFSRAYDWNEDARFLARSKWMDLDEAIRLWPEKKGVLEQFVGGTSAGMASITGIDPDVLKDRRWDLYTDTKRKRLRPVELWYKQRVRKRVLETADGRVTRLDDLTRNEAEQVAEQLPGAVIEDTVVEQMYAAVFCGHIILDGPKVSPYEHNKFPFVQYRAYLDKDGTPKGYVYPLISPQKEINSRRSRALYMLNNRQTIAEEGAIKDKKEWAEEGAQADGIQEIRAGKFERVLIKENTDISQGNLAMLGESKQAMRRISGEDQVANSPEMRSGVGVQRLQMMHQHGVWQLFDNIRRTRRLKALLVFDLIKQYYDEAMVFQITDDPNAARTVNIPTDVMTSLKEKEFDLIAVDTQDFLTAQAEQLEMITGILPQVIQYGPMWARFLISMSDLRNKEGLLQMLDQMNQPAPLEPKFSVSLQWTELTPQEKMVWAPRLGMPELAQAIAQAPTDPSHVIQNRVEVTKAQIKADTDMKKAAIQRDSDKERHQADLSAEALRGLTKIATQPSEKHGQGTAHSPRPS